MWAITPSMSIRCLNAYSVSKPLFALHPQLEADTALVRDLPVCRVLLADNSQFPWLVLVPRRDGLRELFELGEDFPAAMQEMRDVSRVFASYTAADKINVAALGNMVPQLHIHIIARYTGDAAWPNPVWNSGIAAAAYPPDALQTMLRELKRLLSQI
jgi:diadenosine tetraphosphate (Ap4A) HIT family hydrolase